MRDSRRRRATAFSALLAATAVLGGFRGPAPAAGQGVDGSATGRALGSRTGSDVIVGSPGPGPAPGAAAASREGRLVRDTVAAPALEGNALGDATRRELLVYLPPGYDEHPGARFPVLYLLHNYFGDNDHWVDGHFGGFDLAIAMDSLLAEGAARPMIVVMPDARSDLVGSPYLSSALTGDWEGFLRSDVVSHVDRRYRSIPAAEARGIAGHSAGGYAALKLAIKHPETFSVVYGLSPCCLALGTGGWGGESLLLLALAAAEGNPTCGDAGWASQIPALLVHLCPERLRRLRAIRFDVGSDDPFEGAIPAAAAFSRLLRERGIEHRFERYAGDHSGRIGRRLVAEVLPFFSRHLAGADAFGRAGPEASPRRE